MAKTLKQVSLGFPKGYIAQDFDGDVYWYKKKPEWITQFSRFMPDDIITAELTPMITSKQIKELFGDTVGPDRIVRVV